MKESDAFPIEAIIERVVRGDATEAEVAHLNAWRSANAENERTYRDRERMIVAMRSLKADALPVPPRPSAATIIAATRRRRVTALRQRFSQWGGWLAAAVAAGVTLVLQFGSPAGTAWQPAEILTGEAELATVKLPDGTVVRLAPASRLRIAGNATREVSLDGRAFFAVTRSADGQPFRVRTTGATATVLGTRFELSAQGESVHLVVTEGRVSLDAADNSVEVAAGQESGVERGTAMPARTAESAGLAPAWLGRFLVFEATPLRDAMAEIEHLYDARIVIDDETLVDATITASFTDRTLDEVVEVVCTVLNARCTSDRGTVTVSR